MTRLMRKGFQVFLSILMVLTPGYGLAQPPTSEGDSPQNQNNMLETMIQRFAQPYAELGEPPQAFQEASRILLEMGQALEENRFSEYIDSHPELRDKFDVLSLNNQEVDVIDQRTGSVDVTLDFNQYSHQTYPTKITNIEVDFDENDNLIFKGVIVQGEEGEKEETEEEQRSWIRRAFQGGKKATRDKQIGLVHRLNDIDHSDVIDWAYDKELLVLLHRSKGLIVFHMTLARVLLGEAPIPSFVVSSFSLPEQMDSLRMEFIDRSVSPVVSSSTSVPQGVRTNDSRQLIFTAGDLLIYEEKAMGEKHVVEVLSRTRDLNKALFSQYVLLEFLIQQVGGQIASAAEAEEFGNNLFEIMPRDGVVGEILSSVLNKESLLYLHKIAHNIPPVKEFLTLSGFRNRDEFHYNRWVEDYEHLSETAKELLAKRADFKQQSEGVTLSSQEIAQALPSFVADQSDEKEWKKQFKKKFPNFYDFYEDQKWYLLIAAIAGVGAGVQASVIPTLEDSSAYRDFVYNMVFLGMGLVVAMGAVAYSSIWWLKQWNKTLSPGPLKTSVNQVIENWDSHDSKSRLTGLGFRVVSKIIYPFWTRLLEFSGQPHVIPARSQGLNASRLVQPESHLGQQAGLTEAQRLGWSWPPQRNRSSSAYRRQAQLVDMAVEQSKKVQSLSRLLTYYALLNKDFDPSFSISGLMPLVLDENEVKSIYEDSSQRNSFIWASHQLARYIEDSDRINMTEDIVRWDQDVLNEFYQKSLELVQTAKSKTWTRRELTRIDTIFEKWWRKALLWNQERSEILGRFSPSGITAEMYWSQFIMDHATIVTIPLTSLTPRGDYFVGNAHNIGIENNPAALFTSKPHLHELGLNAAVHTMGTARTEVQHLGIIESLRKMFEEFKNLYEPLETHLNSTKNQQEFWNYMRNFGRFVFNSRGDKAREGTAFEERLDFGAQLWKNYKIHLSFFQMGVFTGVTSRLLITDQQWLDTIIGTLYFMWAGYVYFAFPQTVNGLFRLVNDKKLTENKEKIDHIKNILYKMNNNLYSSPENLNLDATQAVQIFHQLYHSSKTAEKQISLASLPDAVSEELQKKDTSAATLRQLVSEMPQEQKLNMVQTLASLTQTSALPTVKNDLAWTLSLLAWFGVFGNIAFVYLATDSFSDPTFLSALYFLAGTAAAMYAANIGYAKKFSENKGWGWTAGVKERIKRLPSSAAQSCRAVIQRLKNNPSSP